MAREAASRPRTPTAKAMARVRRVVFGRPLSSHEEANERLSVATGLPVFASDNISSSAYASEEIMRVLALAGAGALALTMPITVAIVVVLAVVVISYRQTISAYPNGGGSYIVASQNLGTLPGLTAAAALLTDYVLTVSVSVAAGVAALTSIVPELFDSACAIGVAIVIAIAAINLRGIRESGLIFSIPTYVYLVAMFARAGDRHVRVRDQHDADLHGAALMGAAGDGSAGHPAHPAGLRLRLRGADRNGSRFERRAGVQEARDAQCPARDHADGNVVRADLPGPELPGRPARRAARPDRTGNSHEPGHAATFVGAGTPFHYLVQISTAVLLVLAANTSFADFPRLSSILARDGFLPRTFQFRGERLAFNSGIVVLTVLVGLAYRRLWRLRDRVDPAVHSRRLHRIHAQPGGHGPPLVAVARDGAHWLRKAAINGLGRITTGVVAVEVAASKFLLGAWVVLLLIPVLIGMMLFIERQYRSTAEQLSVKP